MLAAAAGFLSIATSATAEPTPEKDWTFSVTPYVWLPAMTGKTTVRGNTADVDTSISDLFAETDFVFALMAEMEAQYKGRWGLAFNGQWTILQQDDNSIGPTQGPGLGPFPIRFDLTMNLGLFEFLGFYDPGDWELGSDPSSPSLFAQPLVGARVTVMRVDFDGKRTTRSVDQNEAWADPILGARFGIHFGPERRWTWRIRGDFGGFGAGSDFTWNLAGILSYDFRAKVPVTVLLGARALYQDFETGSGSSKLRWDVTQYGPLIGVSFPF